MNQTVQTAFLGIEEKQKRKKSGYLLLCFLLPAVLMYFIYLSRGLHPFGDGCVLVLDLNGQYVWFFEALRNFVRGDTSLLYSFERALGGEFIGIYAYYLASPLSFLVCLFPRTKMLEALLCLFLLKTGLCGLTFGYYLKKTEKLSSAVATVAFSTLYALSSYGIVQQHNTMWIDAMMWLPLITLGIESLIKNGKFKLYTLFLAITLFSNFYIGYMVCFWCFFYFFLYYWGHADGSNNPLGEKRHFIKSLFRIFFYSLIALGIASVILLGAYYSLSFGKSTFSVTNWEWYLKFDLVELLYKFLPGSYDTVRPEGYPFLYCGVLTLLLVPAYFLSKKFTIRQKVCGGILILIFLASFSLSVVDLFWHGFQLPNWLNYRYSFMLIFYLCVLACRALTAFETVSLKAVAGMGGLIALFVVFLQKFTDEAYVDPNDYTCIWFTLLCVFVYLAVLGAYRTAKVKSVVCVVLVCTISVEAFLSGLWNMNALDEDVTYSRYSYYNNFLSKTSPIVETVQEKDNSFYRMEKTVSRKVNDNMRLEIRGLSGSTSTLDQRTVTFLNKMGYASLSHWSKYAGGTPVNDSLLGIKYLISDNDVYGTYYNVFATDSVNGYTAYCNPYALSIAYGVDEDLLNFPLGYVTEPQTEVSEQTDEDEETEKKDVIGDAVQKIKNLINGALGIEETVRRAEYIDEYDSPMERLNAILTAMLGEDETVRVFVPITITGTTTNLGSARRTEGHTCYESNNSNGYYSMTFTVPESGEIYFYMPSNYPRECDLVLRNETRNTSTEWGTYGGNDTQCILSLGYLEAGDTLRLSMSPKDGDLYFISDSDFFYYIDWEVFNEVFERLSADSYEITDFTEDSFAGTFKASRANELVMTTIAYDEGWLIEVDGKTVEPEMALGSLLAFHVGGNAGEPHTIKLTYRPKVLLLGAAISAGSILLFSLLCVCTPIFKRIPVLRAVVTAVEPKKRNKKHKKE